MDDPKQHVIDTLKEANNILVTVRSSPSIDQLAACIALTLVLNELDKHGTAVFSGTIPSSLEFLEPEKTIEKNTNSLQDFIISLDKAKADKLRYKIEDDVVKIFITPYRTSLSSADLNFEPGDFNVDVVVALGVHNQDDVDTAITEHGRILHDATVLSINTEGGSSEDLGSIAWIDSGASSLSEMIAQIANQLGKDDAIDNQVATALLAGIVAETERFGNAKTTPETMQVAGRLLAAGANQELVATKLSQPQAAAETLAPVEIEPATSKPDADNAIAELAEPAEKEQDDNADGAIEIEHPITPLSAFAHEDADFEIPQLQPEQGDRPADESGNAPAVPPIYGPDQSPQSDQPSGEKAADNDKAGEPPSFPRPPLANEPQAAAPEEQNQTQAEPAPAPNQTADTGGRDDEQAALDYLKDRKVESHPRARIEPLPSQSHVIEPIHRSAELPELAEGQNPDNIKFALAPPSLGGTLTANLPNERAAASLKKAANVNEATAPILSRDASRPAMQAPAAAMETPAAKKDDHTDDENLMQVLPQAPPPTLAELEAQVHRDHTVTEPQPEQHPTATQTASLITPLIDHGGPSAPPTVALPQPEVGRQPVQASTPPPVPPPMPVAVNR